MKDGALTITRPRIHDRELYLGLHEAIISREKWERVQVKLKHNESLRTPGDRKPTNPLAGLIVCDCCGKKMQRRPQSEGIQTQIICVTRGCPTVAHNADELEQLVLDSLRVFLSKIEVGAPQALDLSAEQTALADLDNKLDALDARLRRTFELIEDGTYTRELFLSRQSELNAKREKLISARTDIEQRIQNRKKEYAAQTGLAPAVRNVLDAYSTDLPVAERNRLLKQVIDHVTYHKRTRTRWNPNNDLALTLHPVVSFPAPHI